MTMSNEAFAVEVVRLHDFFQEWFAGATDASLDEFAKALAEDFAIITPHGSVHGRHEIIDIVERARNGNAVEISIASPTVLVDGELTVGTYEEHQTLNGRTTARISTAVLSRYPDAPGGWLWHLVHETWLPGGAPDQA